MKKLIATAIVSGGIVAGGFVSQTADCEYSIKTEDKEICIDKEVKDAIENSVGISRGFGGIRFGGMIDE